MLSPLDLAVIAAYLAGIVALGLWAGGRQRTADDYFLGGRDLPWWAVCGSVVATETSTLTVIGVPAVAYGGALTFLQLAAGYILGRIVVAAVLLPRLWSAETTTAYTYLGERFGPGMKRLASATFLVTRLLADGVRLFATAIPIRVVALAAGVDVGYPVIIVALAAVTAAYTLVGGLRAVVWMDVVQLALYLGGAVLALVLLVPELARAWPLAVAEGKTQVVDLDLWRPLGDLLTSPYALPVALLGGAVFSIASHGADHLIVQRLLACRTLTDAKRAVIASGVVVFVQVALFLAVGLGLWAHFGGAAPEALGLTRGDEVFPLFILREMPSGVRGLLLAGIVAAAMSTLSSSLNALAGSTLYDLLGRARGSDALLWSRGLTLGWAAVFVVFAIQFESTTSPVVELGLGIAGFTYGALLGAFALGIFVRRARQREAAIAFLVAVAAMVGVIGAVWWGPEGWFVGWRPPPEVRAGLGLRPLAWPLYPLVGAGVSVALGALLARLRASPGASPPDAGS